MFVELNYTDHNGSACPYCGDQFRISGQDQPTEHSLDGGGSYSTTIYSCICVAGHLFLASREAVSTDDEYKFIMRYFGYHEDVNDHFYVNVKTGNGVDFINGEDLIWQRQEALKLHKQRLRRNRERRKLTQEQKSKK